MNSNRINGAGSPDSPMGYVCSQEHHDLFRQAVNEVRSSAAASVQAKAPIWSSSATYGNFSRDGFSWNNDVWGSGAGPQTISVYGANRWSVWSNQPGTGGIKSYPHEAVHIGKPLSAINTLSSTFNQDVPKSGAWDTAYDIWDSSNQHEIMIWTNYTGNSDGSGNVKPISHHYRQDPSGGGRSRSTLTSTWAGRPGTCLKGIMVTTSSRSCPLRKATAGQWTSKAS
ncbi:hypothetical protein ABH973_003782 [Bradyrhizobium ottawaense]